MDYFGLDPPERGSGLWEIKSCVFRGDSPWEVGGLGSGCGGLGAVNRESLGSKKYYTNDLSLDGLCIRVVNLVQSAGVGVKDLGIPG